MLYGETNQISSTSHVFNVKIEKNCGWQFEAIFRISVIWHVRWCVTDSPGALQSNPPNDHFSRCFQHRTWCGIISSLG